MDNMLINACKNGQKGVAQTLLAKGEINVNKRDPMGLTALHYASQKGARDLVSMLLEKGGRAEISEVFERNGVTPQVSLTTWDDYAIMSMVENGLGISILPELILRRAPYRIATLPLDVPAHRDICVAMRSRDRMSNASMRFLGYLDKVDDA